MPYYHGTFRRHLPSIYKHGLGGRITEQNWDGCEPGVYLADNPMLCLIVMLDQYMQFGHPDSNPSQHIKEIVVVVIDDARVDKTKFGPDPLIARKDVHLYNGVIDVTGMPVLDTDTLVPAADRKAVTENQEREFFTAYKQFLDRSRQEAGPPD